MPIEFTEVKLVRFKHHENVIFLGITLLVTPGKSSYRFEIPDIAARRKSSENRVKTPPKIGEVTPFRYAKIEGSPVPFKPPI